MENITFDQFMPLISALIFFATSVFFVAFVIRRIRRVL